MHIYNIQYWFDKMGGQNGCKVVTPQKNVDLKTYTSKRWYGKCLHSISNANEFFFQSKKYLHTMTIYPFPHKKVHAHIQSQAGNPNGKWNYW
jgi:hypothetical protein